MKKKKKWTPEAEYKKKSDVLVKVFGGGNTSKSVAKSSVPKIEVAPIPAAAPARVPASVANKATANVESADAFESNLLDEYKKQMRHNDEVNGLIEKLKSYDQDYQKEY